MLKRVTAVAISAVFASGLLVTSAMAATKTLSGTISDSNCGAHHHIANAAACTRACVKKGASYALVEGDHVYTLKFRGKRTRAALYRLAGKKASVTGTVDGNSIDVKSVRRAK